MLVVKLGGSLLDGDALPRWLEVLGAEGGGRAVVVPGGGPFADVVREAQRNWHFSDAVAHRMALRSMEQFGALLCGLNPALQPAQSAEAIETRLAAGGVPVWLPGAMLGAGLPEVPENWDITSDSLAAWLAARLHASHLVLIKAAAPPPGDLQRLAQAGYVDAAFPAFAGACGAQLRLLGPGCETGLRDLLRQLPQRSPGSQG